MRLLRSRSMLDRHLRTAFRLAGFATLLLAASLLPAPLAAQPAATAPELHGHRRTIGDVDVLFLRGTPRERGFTEGYLMAEELQALFRSFAMSKQVCPQPLLWNLVYLPKVRTTVRVPERTREYLEGLIEGVDARDPLLLEIPELRRDLTADDLLVVATIPDLVGFACSSFAAWGDEAAGEGPVVGRNLDYFATPGLLERTMLVVHAPDGERAGWVGVGWPGVAGCLTGFSDRGVSIAIHDVGAKAVDGETVTPRPVALQEILERLRPGSDAAAAAASIARESRFAMGGNAMVAWRETPGAVVLELHPAADKAAGVTPRGPVDDATWLTCTNHHRARGEPHRRCWRFEALGEGLGDLDALDIPAAWQLIGRSEVGGTLYQCVADLASGEFGVRLRRKKGEDAWDRVDGLTVGDLVREAVRGPDSER